MKRLYSGVVQAEWLDALDHVNFLEHQRVADKANDELWLEIGGGRPTPNVRLSFVIVEVHVRYKRELRLGDPVCVGTRVIAHDHRRVHLYHLVLRGDEVASIVQFLALAFDLDTRRASSWPPAMLEALAKWRDESACASLEGVMDWG
jgi:acyl-CoA thioester hydrolase